MIPANPGLFAQYEDGRVFPIEAWDDGGYPLVVMLGRLIQPHPGKYIVRRDTSMGAEDLARMFHETYERLAPEYSDRTRAESAKPWDELPEANRNLMVATCAEILQKLS